MSRLETQQVVLVGGADWVGCAADAEGVHWLRMDPHGETLAKVGALCILYLQKSQLCHAMQVDMHLGSTCYKCTPCFRPCHPAQNAC